MLLCGTLEVLALVLTPVTGGDLVGLGIRVVLRFFSVDFEAGFGAELLLSGCKFRLDGRELGFDLEPAGAVLGRVDGADLPELVGF